ncbi:DUF2721 domain-containing protein [Anaeromyxobacter paludicola]|uniref:DUF2721 domain-containing protein n=1 Tax=Anaeromyxobacter paludicola TaxID=2918171 RepID=A0ABM7X9Z7_9BACT|nr:DUF2721 domain-containing protein [Anaeromyxobacter paludicola]BDG08672.1 hypothetical protein AMPC_17850 [Anaeromyxobacter paludicola]
MSPDSPVAAVTHAIQLSIAPVFLLTSVAAFLSVLSTRLGRIVDRARVLVDRLEAAPPERRAAIRDELWLLVRRRHLINLAITCGVTTALFVCLLIALAFAGSMTQADWTRGVAALFVLAMIAFVGALLLFLREILLAVASVKIAPDASREE